MEDKPNVFDPPAWATKAIWYQIFVERFRNGDNANNPTIANIQYATVDEVPKDWSLTEWGHNWYEKESWANKMPLDFYRTVQFRRYGGDLVGVLDKLPYLKFLGITAVYFNPLNLSPSMHKYDATCYHHIDVHFGPDPESDLLLIKNESPSDPNTWVWTSADKLFLNVVKQLHEANIKVIMDFSWNHTGHTFWAFLDLKEKLTNSNYVSWYENVQFFTKGEKQTFTYGSWNGITTLPELKKVKTPGNEKNSETSVNLHPEVKSHIFEVCRRWMDPYNDGSITNGVDGFRLDVAELVPLSFWKELRIFTKKINSDFFLVGENWWEEWPDKLLDPRPWLEGDVFDSVMHYHWFQVARSFFGDSEDNINLTQFIVSTQSLFKGIKKKNCQALMNLTASHDSPRLLTSLQNKNKYKYHCKPQEDAMYLTFYPDDLVYKRSILLLIHQFTFLGAPHIWNGDEMGMIGADDPDNRKPLIWPDIHFDDESNSSFSNYTYTLQPTFDAHLFKIFRDLIKLRKKYSCLSQGDCVFVTEYLESSPLLMYTRSIENQSLIICINPTDTPQKLPFLLHQKRSIYQFGISDSFVDILPPHAAFVKFIEPLKTN
ncbi:MAG: alpha-amylase family glycosyl hydrolase [Saprospiraceae bacterium]